MSIQTTKRTVPQLRFPGFTDDWQVGLLDSLLSSSRAKNVNLEFDKSQVLSVAAGAGVVNQIKYHGRSYAGVSVKPYNVIRSGEIVYTKSPLKAYPYGIIKLNEGGDGIVSTLYAVYQVDKKASGKFLDYYFMPPQRINKYLKPLVNIGAKNDMKVNNDVVLSGLVKFPKLEEQQKIADFMGAVDNKLTSVQTKVAAMHEYKKGVMQALFSGKLRFKDEDGNAYPDWEEKKLGELGDFYRGLTYSATNVKHSGNLVLRSSNIQNGNLILDKDLQFVDKNITSNIQLRRDDIVICMANGSRRLVGKSAVYDGSYSGPVTVGAFCSIYRSKSPLVKTLLNTYQYNKYLDILLAGTNINNLKNSDLADLIFKLPSSIEEQQKIADFLTAIDDKIKLEEAKLASAKEFKKGLLQRMFV